MFYFLNFVSFEKQKWWKVFIVSNELRDFNVKLIMQLILLVPQMLKFCMVYVKERNVSGRLKVASH